MSNIKDILQILFRQKKLISLIFITTLSFIIVGAYAWPKSYRADALLLVKLGRENVSAPSIVATEQQVMSFGLTKEQINSEIEILQSRALIEKVVNTLGISYLFPDPVPPEGFFKKIKFYAKLAVSKLLNWSYEVLYFLNILAEPTPFMEAITKIEKNIDVANTNKSNIIELNLHWNDPEIASTIINSLIYEYLNYRRTIYKTPKALQVFNDQTEYFKSKLTATETKLQQYRKDWGIVSLEAQKIEVIKMISDIKKSLQENQSEISKTRKELSELGKIIKKEKNNVILNSELERNPLVDFLKSKLVNLELEKQKLLTSYREDSLQVQDINQQISKVKEDLAKENITVSGRVRYGGLDQDLQKNYVSAEVKLAALIEQKKELLQHLTPYENELKTLGERERRLKELEREIQILRNNYELYNKKLEEARISEVMDSEEVANVSIVSKATPPYTFSKPRRLLIITVGLFIALFTAITSAFYAEFLDHSIKYPEDIEKFLGLPVLTSLKKN